MIAEKARFRHARSIERLVGHRIPDLAFSGQMLEAINRHLNYDLLDSSIRSQILAFFDDFLRCTCRDSPLCGCPEKKFAYRVIELRESGSDHRQISAILNEIYGIEIFPADILSFLEGTVHVLEAISAVARIQKQSLLEENTEKHIRLIER